MIFDRVPDDSQLVCLLGNGGGGPVEAVEEAGLLTLRPKLIPMKYVIPWMILVMVGITCMVCFMLWVTNDRFSSGFFWLFLFSGWFVALPVTLAVFAAVNHSMAKYGDYFKVDMARRTLEVRQLGRTFKASEIFAITLLTRWRWSDIIHQTGVLVRTQDNRVELCRVVCQTGENIHISQRSKWADQLASIFQVPVRRIELSKSESRELNDC